MKMSPHYIKAQASMQAGVITSSGFLGDDTRPILDIISHDEETMQKLGLDFEETAAELRRLMIEGRKGLGEPITVDGRYLVQVNEARGFLPCPFQDGMFRKTNVAVKMDSTDKLLLYSDLSLHLFEVHHFLQGRGSPFRLEPEVLKEFFDL